MKALVVFDSKHGTTEGVAGRIVSELEAGGGKAELLDLRKKGAGATSFAGYDAVVLGAPFYMGSWSKRALAFAAAREADLAGKTFGLFAVGANAELGDKAAKAALPPALSAAASASAYFGGSFDFDRLGWFEKLIVKAVSGKAESSSTLDLGRAKPFAAALAAAARTAG
jgi:menaquinone-dependent protoporphyrinogen oxidase